MRENEKRTEVVLHNQIINVKVSKYSAQEPAQVITNNNYDSKVLL